MRVLVIKTSSMGDVIHTLPALSLAKKARPEIVFDWVVEEAFVDIPALHPAVDKVIPIAWRRWRKQLLRRTTRQEIRAFKENVHTQHYDLVIDAQGLLKSALIAKLCGVKPVVGLDKQSAREPMASYFYQTAYAIEKGQHAILRVQQLFAKALDITTGTDEIADSGIRETLQSNAGHARYVMLLHGTTWPTKHWLVSHWRMLAKRFNENNIEVYLPWGNAQEEQRAHDIAAGNTKTSVLPKQSIRSLADKIANATAVVAVDSGLAHLAAAVATPVYGLYGPTNPELTGVQGSGLVRNLRATVANLPCMPCMQQHCKLDGTTWPCMAALTPEQVFQSVMADLESMR